MKTPTPFEMNSKGRLHTAAEYNLCVKPVVVGISKRGGESRIGAVSREWIVERMTEAGLAPASKFRARVLAENAYLSRGNCTGVGRILIKKPLGFKSYRLDPDCGWSAV